MKLPVPTMDIRTPPEAACPRPGPWFADAQPEQVCSQLPVPSEAPYLVFTRSCPTRLWAPLQSPPFLALCDCEVHGSHDNGMRLERSGKIEPVWPLPELDEVALPAL